METGEQTVERPYVWGVESCDRCGPNVRAKYLAYKEINGEALMLTLCLHHANTNVESLRLDGWEVEEIE